MIDFSTLTDSEISEYINIHGPNFEAYINSDSVLKISSNKYTNQETQYNKHFTKTELKQFFNKNYK